MEKFKIPQDQPIEHPWVTKALERAQQQVERRNFDIRKHLLEYDDVMNKQREVIYRERKHVLEGRNLKGIVLEMIEDTIEQLVSLCANERIKSEDWDIRGLSKKVTQLFPITLSYHSLEEVHKQEEIKNLLVEKVSEAYAAKEARVTEELMRELEKMVLLYTIDSRWKEHLYSMDSLKEGIGLRGYGQRDPLIEYKREAYEMFEDLISGIKREVSELAFKVEVAREPSLEKVLVGERKQQS